MTGLPRLIDLPHRRKLLILSGVLMAMMLSALNMTIVGPTMPTIVRELGGIQLIAWVFTVFSLASTIAVPISGKLSDLYGRKWFYLVGIVIFVAGSMLCGVAGLPWVNAALMGSSAMTQLIAFRGLQGLGAGMLMANGMALVGDMFEPRERGKYQGLFGGVFGVASVLGPVLGGWLTDVWSWRSIFYVNVPIGLAAFTMLAVVLPAPERGQKHSLDWWGTFALVTGLAPLLVALSQGEEQWGWTSPVTLGLLAVAAVALVAFVMVERKAAEPILSMRFFADRSFSASMAVGFFSGVSMFAAIMYLPLFQQVVMGTSASDSGALLTPMLVSMVAVSIVTGQIISRTGRYKVLGIVGLLVGAAGMLMLTRLGIGTTNAYLVSAMVMVGASVGVTMPLFTISLQAQYPKDIGVVTAATQFFRSIGGTLGVALLGGAMNAAFAAELKTLIARDAEKFGPLASTFSGLADKPESLLNAGAASAIMAKVPPQAQAAVTGFLADVKLAFADSIGYTFFIGFVLMLVSIAAMLLVEEIPIAQRMEPPSAEEFGRELLAEEAVLPEDAEPEIVHPQPPSATSR